MIIIFLVHAVMLASGSSPRRVGGDNRLALTSTDGRLLRHVDLQGFHRNFTKRILATADILEYSEAGFCDDNAKVPDIYVRQRGKPEIYTLEL